jgi:hypothetical protein
MIRPTMLSHTGTRGKTGESVHREWLARIFHELLSRDHETGNPLAGLSGAQRARIRWVCSRATAGGWFPYLNGTSQGEPVLSEVEGTPEDAREDNHISGRSK